VIDSTERPFRAGALYGTYEAFRYKVRQAVLVRDCCSKPARCVCTRELCVDTHGPGFAAQVPGIYKIRYVGQTTLSSAAVRAVCCFKAPNGHMPEPCSGGDVCVLQVFGLFLGAGSLLHCGR